MTAFKKSHIITWATEIIRNTLCCVFGGLQHSSWLPFRRSSTCFLLDASQCKHIGLSANIQALNKVKLIWLWFFFFYFMLPDACKSCQDLQSRTDAPVPDFGRRRGSGTVQSVVAAAFFILSCQAKLSTSPDCVSSTSVAFYLLTGLHPSLLPATCVVVQGNTHRPLHTHSAE